MNAKDAIKQSLVATQGYLQAYVSDLSDADLLVRPVPDANHIAWQLGHLVAVEAGLAGVLPGAKYPALPPELASQMSGKSAATPPPGGYLTKAQYLDWFTKVRGATIASVDSASDADLDKPLTGDFAKWAPTVGALLVLVANHTLMHGGQFTVVRRALKKPVLF